MYLWLYENTIIMLMKTDQRVLSELFVMNETQGQQLIKY